MKYNRLISFSIVFFLLVIILLLIILIRDNKATKIQEQASLFYKIQDDFFFKNTQLIKVLRLVQDDSPVLEKNGGEFSEYELDDYLGFFELLNKYVNEGIVPLDWVYNQFGYYIVHAYNNMEVKNYIYELKNEDASLFNVFSGFEILAEKCIQLDNSYNKNTIK